MGNSVSAHQEMFRLHTIMVSQAVSWGFQGRSPMSKLGRFPCAGKSEFVPSLRVKAIVSRISLIVAVLYVNLQETEL